MRCHPQDQGEVLLVGPLPPPGQYVGGIAVLLSQILRCWDLPYKVAFYNTESVKRDYASTGRLSVENLRRLVLNATSLLRTVRRHRPCLVHYHTSRHAALLKDLIIVAVLRSLGRCRVIGHIHHASYATLLVGKSRWGRVLQIRLMARLFDRIVLMSKGIKGELAAALPVLEQSRFEAKARVVYNFTDLPVLASRGSPEARPLSLLFIGNVGRSKGVFELLAAVERLLGDMSGRLQLVVMGPFDSPSVGEEVEAVIRKARLTEGVRLTGQVSGEAKEAFFRAADVFVLPSHAEGVPLSMLEAMAYALPVVATSVGGIPEVLPDGEAGLLVEPGDVEGLCDAIRKLSGSVELRNRLGQCGRSRVERWHTPDRFLRAMETIYGEVLNPETLPDVLQTGPLAGRS
jgi:glycosyltransferase involved in cell wall biosynthesis